MGTNLLGELAANNGTYFFSGGEYSGSFDQVIVRGPGVICISLWMIIDGSETEVTVDYLFHGKETYLTNGVRITPKGNDVFSKISIESNTSPELGTGLELVLA